MLVNAVNQTFISGLFLNVVTRQLLLLTSALMFIKG